MTLQQFFTENPETAIGFSGGTDSSYLLYSALRYAKRVRAYYVKTVFQPQFELDDARNLVGQLGADLAVLPVDILRDSRIAENPENRCYFCKATIFSVIGKQAAADGFPVLADGTNASDDASDRPGMRALEELHVRSPLRESGLTKNEIRRLSHEAGLFTWNKSAYACLATRIPSGCRIDSDTLARVEQAENALFSLGFSGFRVRVLGTAAKLQILPSQLSEAFVRRQEIKKALSGNFTDILLDLTPRKEEPVI